MRKLLLLLALALGAGVAQADNSTLYVGAGILRDNLKDVSRVMGHSKSTLVDAVYAHSMASGLSGVAENVTARALGLNQTGVS